METTLLEKRTIEAEALEPVLKAFIEELGREKVKRILFKASYEGARRYGRELAGFLGSPTLEDLAKEVRSWGGGGALEEKIVEQTQTTLFLDVTRCRFAELYDRLGIRDLGVELSCCRDFGFIEGFHPGIRLVRTQTIMEGAPTCDFRFFLES